MTEQELAAIESRWQEHERACRAQQGCCGSVDDVPTLVAEVRGLQAQVADDSKFIAELQSELLSKRAERPDCTCEVCGQTITEAEYIRMSVTGIRHHARCVVASPLVAKSPREILAQPEDVRPHDPGSPVRRGPSLFRVAAPDHVVGD